MVGGGSICWGEAADVNVGGGRWGGAGDMWHTREEQMHSGEEEVVLPCARER